MVVQLAVNQKVVGSSPTLGADINLSKYLSLSDGIGIHAGLRSQILGVRIPSGIFTDCKLTR